MDSVGRIAFSMFCLVDLLSGFLHLSVEGEEQN